MTRDDKHHAHIEMAALGRLAHLGARRMRKRKTRVLQDAELLGRLEAVAEATTGCRGFAPAPPGFLVQDWVEHHCQFFLRALDEHVETHLDRAGEAPEAEEHDPEPERERPVA